MGEGIDQLKSNTILCSLQFACISSFNCRTRASELNRIIKYRTDRYANISIYELKYAPYCTR